MDAPACTTARTLLTAVLSRLLAPELFANLARQAAPPVHEAKLLAALASAGRKLGSAAVELPREHRDALSALGYRQTELVPLVELVRVFLLVEACQALEPAAQLGLLTRAYRTSSNEERTALLRALLLLPDPERFLPIATDACRTHVLDVFQAIACDNPYPARYFDDPSFNQLVVKALFVGAALARVEGLRERHNTELLRMVRDYVSERRAAGRSIPADVTLIDP